VSTLTVLEKLAALGVTSDASATPKYAVQLGKMAEALVALARAEPDRDLGRRAVEAALRVVPGARARRALEEALAGGRG
jgi:hypothetical protein